MGSNCCRFVHRNKKRFGLLAEIQVNLLMALFITILVKYLRTQPNELILTPSRSYTRLNSLPDLNILEESLFKKISETTCAPRRIDENFFYLEAQAWHPIDYQRLQEPKKCIHIWIIILVSVLQLEVLESYEWTVQT